MWGISLSTEKEKEKKKAKLLANILIADYKSSSEASFFILPSFLSGFLTNNWITECQTGEHFPLYYFWLVIHTSAIENFVLKGTSAPLLLCKY